MKHPKVLNRRMFNPNNNSAYGRGIAANLVTEEERQKFNWGGRVGLASAGSIESRLKFDDMKMPKNIDEAYQEWLYPDEMSIDPTMEWGAFGVDVVPKEIRKFQEYAIDDPEGVKKHWEKNQGKKLLKKHEDYKAAKIAAGEGTPDENELQINLEEKLRKKINPDKKGSSETTEIDISEKELPGWTEKEKEEKKRDMWLAMASRLIGGARDPWGSTKQMKNISGAIDDIRKITDKEDIRKDWRKYTAYADAAQKIDENRLKHTQRKDVRFNDFVDNGGDKDLGLQNIYGVPLKILDFKNDKDQLEIKRSLKDGDIIKENNSYKIFMKDEKTGQTGFVDITFEDIVKMYS